MKKHLTRVLGAGALSFAALGASMPASAEIEAAATQFPCPAGEAFSQCYFGAVVGSMGDSMFSDVDIGFVNLSALTDLSGDSRTKWLDLDSVTLTSGGSSFTADPDKQGEFSFADLAAGIYRVTISGTLEHPDRFPNLFGHDDFRVRAGLYALELGAAGQSVVPQIPEPETYALMLAGLLTVGLLARRRSPQAELTRAAA